MHATPHRDAGHTIYPGIAKNTGPGKEIIKRGIHVSISTTEMAEEYASRRGARGGGTLFTNGFRSLIWRDMRCEKVQGMATESERGFRGWVYAILVAICLLFIFFATESFSRVKQPGFDHAPRTSHLVVSTKPTFFPKIATESLPLEIESMSGPIESSTWLNYRIAPSSSIAMLDPPAGARLAAPISSATAVDPFLDPSRNQRTPSILAEFAANSPQTAAIPVSTNQLIEGGEQFDRSSYPISQTQSPSPANNTWPTSTRLLNEIAKVKSLSISKSQSPTEDWVQRVSVQYDNLTALKLSDDRTVAILDQLHQLADEGGILAGNTLETEKVLSSDIARLSYSIERRVVVWKAVSACVAKGRTHFVSARKHEIDAGRLKGCLAEVKRAIQQTGDASNWNQYLLLDSLNQLASGEINGSQNQVDLVRQFLGRVTGTNVTAEQRAILSSTEVHKLADQVHPLSIAPVDYRKLIEDIETLESDSIHRCSKSLADAMQSLRFSEHPEQASVSQAIGVHYRNANLRIAVSESFINRMLPPQSTIQKPVKQNILGADTRGASEIQTKLRVDCIKDPSALKIALNLDGDISSRTQSSRHGATFYNSSIANVNTVREVTITSQGMTINGRPASVESRDSLRNFSTDWDKLPILGDMVRQFAHNEFLQARPLAKRIMQKTIAKQTDEEFDKQLQEKVSTANLQFKSRLLGPLQSLNLQPMVMDMETTDTRLVVRYRLASSDQLSAYTSRPIAPSDSQLSLQVHHSAFNNMVSQVVEGDRNWTMQELSDKISDLMQQPRRPLTDDAPTDVTARFADSRPITVEFEDGRMTLTLRIASLEQPGRIHLKNFIIRASYLPTVDGLQAELTRDGVISVDGPKLGTRDRVPLRAIFAKVFSNRSSIPMVSEELLKDPRAKGLAVSQLILNDGWLGVAVSEANSPHVAIVKANQDALQR